jgi:hypothetical protein
MKAKRPKRHLYTPNLSDENVRKLYQLAPARHVPMTFLLNLLVRQALHRLEHGEGPAVDHHTEA